MTTVTVEVSTQPDLLDALGGDDNARRIADIFTREGAKDPQLSKLIHSSLDMDRLDYLLRDSLAAGVPYGRIDLNYILNNVKRSPTGMVGVTWKALAAAEQFLLARSFMHRAVYFHKTTIGIEEACRQLLRRLRDSATKAKDYGIPQDGREVERLVRTESLGTFTDAWIDQVVEKATRDDDSLVAALAGSIHHRRPPKLLKEVYVLRPHDDQHHRGSAFLQKCRYELKKLADDSSVPVGELLIWESGSIRFEKRGSSLSAREARALASETEDELIKVFVAGEKEPKSLVDIPDSIISVLSNQVVEIYRLYVVCNDRARESTVEDLREQVKDWDKLD